MTEKTAGSTTTECVLLTKTPKLKFTDASDSGNGPVLRRRRILFHILVVPTEVPLITIAHVTWARDAVELVGIDHELGFDAETAQGLIHLLAALDGDVEVALAAEEQCRRLDAIGVQEG